MNGRIIDKEIRIVVVAAINARIQRIGFPASVNAILIEFVLICALNATTAGWAADAQPHRFDPKSVGRIKIHPRRRIGGNDAIIVRTPVVKFARQKYNGWISYWSIEKSYIDAVSLRKEILC